MWMQRREAPGTAFTSAMARCAAAIIALTCARRRTPLSCMHDSIHDGGAVGKAACLLALLANGLHIVVRLQLAFAAH